MDQDWYDAIVIDNSIVGDAFPVGESCVYRRREGKKSQKLFEIFNIKDTAKIITGEVAKQQLRASRNTHNEVIRSKDQGYINWKYSSIGENSN